MEIRETTTRECCQPKDLKVLAGILSTGNRLMGGMDKEFKFCVHCGRHYEYYRYRDAAGASDWEYRPMKWPWE